MKCVLFGNKSLWATKKRTHSQTHHTEYINQDKKMLSLRTLYMRQHWMTNNSTFSTALSIEAPAQFIRRITSIRMLCIAMATAHLFSWMACRLMLLFVSVESIRNFEPNQPHMIHYNFGWCVRMQCAARLCIAQPTWSPASRTVCAANDSCERETSNAIDSAPLTYGNGWKERENSILVWSRMGADGISYACIILY